MKKQKPICLLPEIKKCLRSKGEKVYCKISTKVLGMTLDDLKSA